MRSKVTRWGSLLLLLAASLGLGSGSARAQSSDSPADGPNDPLLPLQWNLQMVGAPAAWKVATGSGITIAVVDSGIDLDHEDLHAKIVDHVDCIGHPCQTGPKAGQDDNGHGTHVSGIAAAMTNNGTGVAGVAPDAQLLAVKVLAQSCDVTGCTASGTADDVARGITYAADHGAQVINLSLGNTSQSIFGPAFQAALDDAWSKGSIPVLAAGNDFVLPSGGIDHAIVVGALDRDGTRSQYSNIGTSAWSISAPGGSAEGDSKETCQQDPQAILSTYIPTYACISGTSMAAPHVSGAIALLRSMGYSQQDAVSRVLATARPAGTGTGAGALDVAAAVGAAATPPPDTSSSSSSSAPPTSSDATAPGTGSESSGGVASSSSNIAEPTGDLGVPSPTMPESVITPSTRAASGSAAGRVNVRTPIPSNDLPGGTVAVAVLLAAGVGTASGWQLVRGSSWARRTPPTV